MYKRYKNVNNKHQQNIIEKFSLTESGNILPFFLTKKERVNYYIGSLI